MKEGITVYLITIVVILAVIAMQINMCTSTIKNKLDKLIELSTPQAINIIDEKFELEK